MKSGNLNFLEPSGPLQAGNGTVLPFFYQAYTHNLLRYEIKCFTPIFVILLVIHIYFIGSI